MCRVLWWTLHPTPGILPPVLGVFFRVRNRGEVEPTDYDRRACGAAQAGLLRLPRNLASPRALAGELANVFTNTLVQLSSLRNEGAEGCRVGLPSQTGQDDSELTGGVETALVFSETVGTRPVGDVQRRDRLRVRSVRCT